ncbi:hypothetical protein I3842_12G039400 [Carya illinoinensis]|uniref:Uncharacterized protein n=1 Tax=Carya illinoinensis TaxID=32201 RepID=A0A922DGJ8_CARIL|nr:hypothetical protein I3842_12G039400 [Carya illinoinensis]KAG6683959.1 hypothetical protein I3842_12G039400 [Carya illinoinensis]KAG6683960.1 hypothetical protein I3842_12G039400 [Carya illinoinensis]
MATSHSTSTGTPPLQRSPSSNQPPILSSDSNGSKQDPPKMTFEEEITASIQDKLHAMDLPAETFESSIFRIPDVLRRHNENAFMPKVVSIGPFHHENMQLREMEKTKLLYLNCFISRTGTEELQCLLKAVGSIKEVRLELYEGLGVISKQVFFEMMVIDGCFILEFLCRNLENMMDDPVFQNSWMPRKIIADLLLLENQLPWCILDLLCNLVLPSLKTINQCCYGLNDLVSFSFHKYRMFPSSACNDEKHKYKHKHLLDCFRNYLVGSCTIPRPDCSVPSEWNPVGLTVTELLDSGVCFYKAEVGDHSILDVKFEDGKMKMPAIFIEENTESVLRNLIAFEHCDPSKGYEITSYAALLDYLIKSPADALHLQQKHILHSGLSNEDTASFLNRLLHNGTSLCGFLYSDLCKSVNDFKSTPLRRYQATLRRDYFKDPSAVFTLVFGIAFTLFLGILQTIFTILSYFK